MRTILEDIPFRNKRPEIGLTLRESWFLNGRQYNSEIWGEYNKSDLNDLEVLDRIILRKILSAHSKSQNYIFYIESGVLPFLK